MLPTLLLQATGNAVMQVSLKRLQGEFIANLAKDYDRWGRLALSSQGPCYFWNYN
jgi:hypothetical protein